MMTEVAMVVAVVRTCDASGGGMMVVAGGGGVVVGKDGRYARTELSYKGMMSGFELVIAGKMN